MLAFAITLALISAESPDAALMRAAAKDYRAWGRVDERAAVAPAPCADLASARDRGGVAASARLSASGPHDKKLYYLWASSRDAYLNVNTPEASAPVGFTIVKESFKTKAHKPKVGMDLTDVFGSAPAPVNWVTLADGSMIETAQPSTLFIMTKVGPRDDADAGWLYGTVAPNGKVTGVGKIANCMGCHEKAPHDRLFGLAPK